MITFKKDDDDFNFESYCVDKKTNKQTDDYKMARLSPFVDPLWPGLGLSGLVMAFLACVWPF